MRTLCLFSALLLSSSVSARLAVATDLGADKRVDGFSLRDYRGKVHSLDELSEHKLLVVAFLGPPIIVFATMVVIEECFLEIWCGRQRNSTRYKRGTLEPQP